ncbi:hypothetical protein ABIB62_002471 [Mucilaginibacter sp. UYP25]|uniref:hypothetical protein n=1 Tax=unclassified Mucilaginibacter TaxID=2617802 RepID=UPI003391EB0C
MKLSLNKLSKIIAPLIITFAIVSFLNCEAQNLKTFHGKYDNGLADYTYYEKDYERFYEGPFSFSQTLSITNDYKEITKVSGKFHQDLKQGLWKYTFTRISKGKSSVETVSGSYVNGEKVGQWIDILLSKTGRAVKKSLVNFAANKLVGHFLYSYDSDEMFVPPNTNYVIEGNLTENGLLDGTVIMNYTEYNKNKFQTIYKYRKGLCYWNLSRNLSTGEITNKTDRTDLVEDIFKNSNLDQVLKSNKSDTSIVYKNQKYNISFYRKVDFSILSDIFEYWETKTSFGFDEGFSKNDLTSALQHGSKPVENINPLVFIAVLLEK